jgi:hypothetical protein
VALRTAIELAGRSLRPYAHAASLYDRLLASSHIEGWPSSLFHDSSCLDSFFGVAGSTADQPDYREAVSSRLLDLAQAMMVAPVSASELEHSKMDPHVLRADIGLAAAYILEHLGNDHHEALRDAARAAAAHPSAQPSAEELHEFKRVPRWLGALLSSSREAQRYARDEMPEERAAQLSRFIQEARGDLGALQQRLQRLWRTPLTRAWLMKRFEEEAEPKSVPSHAVQILDNTQIALLMLMAYDARTGTTRHAVDAARALVKQTSLDKSARDLVRTARLAVGSPASTPDDKRAFIMEIPRLLERGAWPGTTPPHDNRAIYELIKGVADLVREDKELADVLFGILRQAATTPVEPVPERGETGDDEKLERWPLANAAAELARELDRPDDASVLSGIADRLMREHTSKSTSAAAPKS